MGIDQTNYVSSKYEQVWLDDGQGSLYQNCKVLIFFLHCSKEEEVDWL